MKLVRKKPRDRKGESGQSIVESVMCMMIICLILFGLLQIFYLTVCQMVTDFSGFYAAQSRAVGFADYLVIRNARISAVGASGNLSSASFADTDSGDWSGFQFDSLQDQVDDEKIWLYEYASGIRWIEYEYWFGTLNEYGTAIGISSSESFDTIRTRVGFTNYPFDFPMSGAFSASDTVSNITGEGRIMNYADYYLETGE